MKTTAGCLVATACVAALSGCGDDAAAGADGGADLVDRNPGDGAGDRAGDGVPFDLPSSDIPASDMPASDVGPDATDDTTPPDSSDDSPPDAVGGDADDGGTPIGGPGTPLVPRGADYMGSSERFNRYYTDRAWSATRTVWVSPSGGGSGASRGMPTDVDTAFADARPGDRITFIRGTYAGCYELDSSQSGTYNAPIVLYAERNGDGSRGVQINCCGTGRQTCINLEAADYVAVDGFEAIGGNYGVRAVGGGYDAPSHQVGVAVLDCHGHGQYRDPFFTGQSDWAVFERSIAHDSGVGDGHGFYLSNGGDWNIVRYNETFDTASSDFQINADPISTCSDVGILYDDPQCDGSARDGLGQGVSEFITLDGNHFHHSNSQGPNFTSVRNSVFRNNVFGFATRHGTSFWQETNNPRLGSSDNIVHHNLFIGTNSRELVQFIVDSGRNDVRNNVFVGISWSGSTPVANPSTQLVFVDGTTDSNTYAGNYYIAGRLVGRSVEADERSNATFDPSWFSAFPEMASVAVDVHVFIPAVGAPFRALGTLLTGTTLDLDGQGRTAPVDLGPFEVD